MGESHPARPVLARVVVFWLAGWLSKLGVRGGEGYPNQGKVPGGEAGAGSQQAWDGSLLGGRRGAGDGMCRSGLHPRSNTCSSRTGGDQVTGLAAVAAETSVKFATAFV